ncbi:MAG: hypothetical protein PHF86_09840 [Candidatus Nanoarchaeia archaeon]|nr:hypothetical protein [Candidatus Nanoarchaeia archaeon]
MTTIPSGSHYVSSASTSGTFSFFTPSDTSIYVADSINYSDDESDKSDNDGKKWVKRAIRLPKKQKGAIQDANHPRNRIKNLLKPVVVFKFLKDRFKPMERRELSQRLEKVASILESTAITNQIALKEKIHEKFGKFLREQEMIACGFDKYFEKEILQAFVESVQNRIIKITPIKNYIRLIPKDIRERMEVAREKMLFDDFVVIHTDPDNKAVEKTQAEKKDPILCGVIKESTRYYFVGDWQDALCDLTMDTILEHFGLDEGDVTLTQDVEAALLEIL